MKPFVVATVILAALLGSGCLNYRVGQDVENPTVQATKTGQDCAYNVWGLGFEPSRRDAMRDAGLTRVRNTYDLNRSFFGIGRYCHVVVGE